MRIIYKDRDILIVEKPRQMPVHQLSDADQGTLGNMLLDQFPELRQVGGRPLEAGLVQRLDNDTSGVMIVARNRNSWLFLREQFKRKTVIKEYFALVLGQIRKSGEISSYIAHSKKSKKKMVVVAKREVAVYKARKAVSFYLPLKCFKEYSLVKVVTCTGLRHQVRVQLAWLGYPLVGDKLYQNRKQRENDRLFLQGHFLHASKITFIHPQSQRQVSFSCPLPQELQQGLQTLA